MTTAELQKDYLKYLKEHANPARAVKDKAYLYSADKHYGLPSALTGQYYKKVAQQLRGLSKAQTLEFVNFFWNQESFEEKMLALHILNLHIKELDISDIPLIEKLMRESRGWVYLDSFILQIMPELLAKNKQTYKYLDTWIQDNDFWVRRSALLAQLFFFRDGTKGDKALFFKMAESQFNESWIDDVYKDKLTNSRAKFFIRKAIGWTLRDMSIKDPKSVVEFLNRNKDKLSGLSYREGSRKLPVEFAKQLI